MEMKNEQTLAFNYANQVKKIEMDDVEKKALISAFTKLLEDIENENIDGTRLAIAALTIFHIENKVFGGPSFEITNAS